MSQKDVGTNMQIVVELTREGFSLMKQGRLDEAEGRFKVALGYDPENEYALSGLGGLARKRGEVEKAAEFYAACVKAHPKNGFALYGLGDCYRGMNQLQRAIEAWRGCLDIDPNNVNAISSIADAYRMQLDLENARAFYERTLAIDPHDVHAIKGLGYLFYDLKRFEEGVAYWEEAMKNEPGLRENPEALIAMGNCLRRAFKHEEALEAFKSAAFRGATGFAIEFGLADCYRGLKEFTEAKANYDRILAREPENQTILTRAGDMCVNLGEVDLAEGYFKRALGIGDDVYACLGLAHVRKHKGDYEEALRILEDTEKRFSGFKRLQGEIQECRAKLK